MAVRTVTFYTKSQKSRHYTWLKGHNSTCRNHQHIEWNCQTLRLTTGECSLHEVNYTVNSYLEFLNCRFFSFSIIFQWLALDYFHTKFSWFPYSNSKLPPQMEVKIRNHDFGDSLCASPRVDVMVTLAHSCQHIPSKNKVRKDQWQPASWPVKEKWIVCDKRLWVPIVLTRFILGQRHQTDSILCVTNIMASHIKHWWSLWNTEY